MKVIDRNIGDIKPYKNNPRINQGAVDSVAQSIKEFGFKQPIVVDKKNVIIIGHTRLLAAKELKLKKVPVLVADDLPPKKVKALRIADNKTGELSDWDFDLLKDELNGLDDVFTGFDGDELDELFNTDNEGLTDENDMPEPKKKSKVKIGDIFQLGNHRLMCGDSTNKEHVLKLMNGKKADQLITDPPYNVAYEGKTKDALTIQNDSMSDDGFRKFLRDAFAAADAVMKQGAVFYIWHADSEGYNFRGACHDVGWQVRQCLIWNKNSMVMGRQDYHWKHEPCLYGWKDGAGHLWNTDRKQVTILDFNRPTRNAEHPTMKPVDLIEYQILNNTKGQDIVLDLFGGSGTTLIAAAKNGRKAYLMELDPVYIDVIIKRWENFTGNKAKKVKR